MYCISPNYNITANGKTNCCGLFFIGADVIKIIVADQYLPRIIFCLWTNSEITNGCFMAIIIIFRGISYCACQSRRQNTSSANSGKIIMFYYMSFIKPGHCNCIAANLVKRTVFNGNIFRIFHTEYACSDNTPIASQNPFIFSRK